MVLSWIFTIIIAASVLCAAFLGNGAQLAAAIPKGAQNGVTVAISMAGAICLWTGIGRLMEKAGITGRISKLLKPILRKLFPSSQKDPQLANSISANICANLIGLGNAATPMGIQAVRGFSKYSKPGVASDEMCRLIVLNTASIQLIPATVAAVRSSLGALSPFDILPAVWITSICSASIGLLCAWGLGRLWKN